MKAIPMILLLAAAAFAQVNPLDDLARLEAEMNTEPVTVRNRNWILVDQNRIGRWYYKDWTRYPNGDVELWIKVVPAKPQQFAAMATNARGRRLMRGFHHFVQYTIFHCSDERRSTEKLTAYRRNGSVIISDTWLSVSDREVIEPDSINRGIFDHFCTAVEK